MKLPHSSGHGVCAFEALTKFMAPSAIEKAQSLCPNPESVIFYLFPYLSPGSGNISKYARGEDYHKVLPELLAPFVACMEAEHPEKRFVILSDDSPLPEVMGAYLSGAGILGKNGLIFDEKYGSYVFIGSVLTDLHIAPTAGGRTCSGCLKCVKACPHGALSEHGFDISLCLSHMTQKNGEFSEFETQALEHAPLVWGCDICSDVCPLNANVPFTSNPAFSENLIYSIKPGDVDALTRRKFLAKYPNRAFTWKGPSPLVRNLKLK